MPSTEPEHFDILETDLSPVGFNLIEASAGSGKTYSISFIVLRLLTELGIPLDKLLIITFTKSAAAEMTDRIHGLINEAIRLLQPNATDSDHHPTPISQWAQSVIERSKQNECLQLLKKAQLQPDQLMIGTNDSAFFQCTNRYALDMQTPLELPEQLDEARFFRQSLRETWIEQAKILPDIGKKAYFQIYPKPDKFASKLRAAYLWGVRLDNPQDMTKARQKFVNAVQTLATTPFPDGLNDLDEGLLNGRSRNKVKRLLRQASNFQAGFFCEMEVPDLSAYCLNSTANANQETMQAFLQKPEFDDFFMAIKTYQAAIKLFQIAIHHEALAVAKKQLETHIDQTGQWSYSSVAYGLDRFLKASPNSPLHGSYDALVVDEFQDTNAIQWSIFKQLLQPKIGIGFLIGDPKQSIYRFRHSDLNVYFDAKNACQNVYQLPKNWRSTPTIVQGVNALFSQEDAFVDQRLSYAPAQAASQDPSGQATMVVFNEQKEGKEDWQKTSFEQLIFPTVNIVLHHLQQGTAPEEVLILVNTHQQAHQLYSALQSLNIPCHQKKIPSDRQKLIDHFAWLVETLNHPYEVKKQQLMRVTLLQEPLKSVLHAHDSNYWQSLLVKLKDQWQTIGPLGIWQYLLKHTNIQSNYEQSQQKILLDFMPLLLGELQTLWQNNSDFSNHSALLMQWFEAIKVFDQDLPENSHALRIYTTQSAKGLEAKVVICPALLTVGMHKSEPWVSLESDTTQLLAYVEKIEKNSETDLIIKAQEEAEARRKLYVALTRACTHLYLFVSKAENSLQRLLKLSKNHSPEDFRQAVEQMGGWHFESPNDKLPKAIQAVSERPAQDIIDLATYPVQRGVSSFSQLTQFQSTTDWHDDPFQRLGELERQASDDQAKKPLLPSNARTGNILHNALQIIFDNPSLKQAVIDLSPQGTDFLWKHFNSGGFEAEAFETFSQCVRMPILKKIPTLGSDLSAFQPPSLCCEMQFTLGITQMVDTRALNEASQDFAKQWLLKPLPEKSILQGLFTGFIDLTVQSDNQFWVIDYKSNFLQTYQQQALRQSMYDHYYGWQSSFYLLAMHRYLKRVFPNYDLATNLGGAVYLYIRGMDEQSADSGIVSMPADLTWITHLDALIPS